MKKSCKKVQKGLIQLQPKRLKFEEEDPKLIHSLEDMHWYLTRHFYDAEEPILRHKIKQIFRYTTSEHNKKKLRGILCYLNRWPRIKSYMKLAEIMERETENLQCELEVTPILPISGKTFTQATVMRAAILPDQNELSLKLEITE